MVDNDYIYAVYANKDLAPPSSDYWAKRRRVASLIRSFQEKIQTTALPVADLARLGDALQGQLQGLPEAPAMEGSGAWLEHLVRQRCGPCGGDLWLNV